MGMGGIGLTGTTFRVSGRRLFDSRGEEVVLRGVNEMIVWSGSKDGDPEFAEIAKTGANVAMHRLDRRGQRDRSSIAPSKTRLHRN